MKKLSLVFILVALVAACLVGGAAFASASYVTTHEDVFVGTYNHNHPDYQNDKECIIVFGTADLAAAEEGTQYGVVVTNGDTKYYFPAKTVDKATGNFGVALIKSTILDGDFTAKAFSVVGGKIDTKTGTITGGVITEAEGAIDLSVDNVQMSQTATEFTVTADESVDLKDYINITGADKSSLTYTAKKTRGTDRLSVAINDGVVSWVSGSGTYEITASHVVSGESVTFTVDVFQKIVEVKDRESFLSLKDYPSAYAYFTADVEIWNEDTVGKSSILPSNFYGIMDGNGHTLRYNRDYSTSTWYGLAYMLGEESVVSNLVIEIDAHLNNRYSSVLTHESRGIIENCYIKTYVTCTRTDPNYNDGMGYHSLTRYHSGTYRNVIIENLNSYPISINDTGKFENVAWIQPALSSNYRKGLYTDKLTSEQMVNFCYYSSFDNFLAGSGQNISHNDETDEYVKTDLVAPQNLGSAWNVSAEGVVLNGKVVRGVDFTFDYITTTTGSVVFTEAGQTEQLEMCVNGEYNEMFSFSSSKTAVATVEATSGLVTAVAPGKAEITATHRFTGKSTTILVVFADKIVEVASVEDLAKLDRISGEYAPTTTTLIRQTEDIVIDDISELSHYNNGTNDCYSIIPGYWTSTNTVTTGDTAFVSVYDGQGYSITVDVTFEKSVTTTLYRGFASGIAEDAMVRNLVLNQNVVNVQRGSNQFASTLYGYVDNSFISTTMVANTTGGNSYLRMQFCARSYYGLVRNTIINSDLTYNGSKTTATLANQNGDNWENIAAIGTYGHVISTNGVNFGAADESRLVNLCRYTTGMDNFFSLTGWWITRAQIDETSVQQGQKKYYGTPLTAPQFIGKFKVDYSAKTITMDVDGTEKVIYPAE